MRNFKFPERSENKISSVVVIQAILMGILALTMGISSFTQPKKVEEIKEEVTQIIPETPAPTKEEVNTVSLTITPTTFISEAQSPTPTIRKINFKRGYVTITPAPTNIPDTQNTQSTPVVEATQAPVTTE